MKIATTMKSLTESNKSFEAAVLTANDSQNAAAVPASDDGKGWSVFFALYMTEFVIGTLG